MLLFLLVLFPMPIIFSFYISTINLKNELKTYATNELKKEEFCFEFIFNGKRFKFLSSEILPKLELSEIQKNFISDSSKRYDYFNKIKHFVADDIEAIFYCYPEVKVILEKLKNNINLDYKKSEVFVIQNSCRLDFHDGKPGRFIDLNDFSNKFISQIKSEKNAISFEIVTKNYNYNENLREMFKEKGCFSTNFSSSSEARKNNIRTALSAFDGIILEEGEMLSFNNTTGVRSAESGYMPAKIISGGTFTEGFGGGVCQVSTTIYNACLLSGLEIVEVNSHSLPVSYIEPSFDAMVNVGSSDLVVRNNTGGKIIFTTSYINDICKVKIFGEKNKYKITRFSEKTKIIPAEPDKIETDYSRFGVKDLAVGEEIRISYPKDGFCSNGYLNFYDSNGNLVETKKIRSNRYNPTKGIVVKREY